MNAITSLLLTLTLVLDIILGAGSIVAGVWFAIVGHWKAIGLGIAFNFLGSHVLSLLLAPSVFFADPSNRLFDAKQAGKSFFFGTLLVIYMFVVLSAWNVLSLFLFLWLVDFELQILSLTLAAFLANLAVYQVFTKATRGDPDGDVQCAAICSASRISCVVVSVLFLLYGTGVTGVFVVFLFTALIIYLAMLPYIKTSIFASRHPY